MPVALCKVQDASKHSPLGGFGWFRVLNLFSPTALHLGRMLNQGTLIPVYYRYMNRRSERAKVVTATAMVMMVMVKIMMAMMGRKKQEEYEEDEDMAVMVVITTVMMRMSRIMMILKGG